MSNVLSIGLPKGGMWESGTPTGFFPMLTSSTMYYLKKWTCLVSLYIADVLSSV